MTRPRSRLAKATAGLASLLTLAALIAGLPAALYAVSGSPIPRTTPSWQQVTATLARPDHGTLLLGGIRWLSWLAWAAFTISALMEAVSAARGRASPRLPVLTPVQGFAAALVGTAIVGLLPGPHLPRSSPPPSPPAPAAATAPPPPRQPAWAVPVAALQPARARAVSSAAPHRVLHTVAEGENLWDIAARYLGNGERWHEIFTLNRGKPQPGGGRLTDPDLIDPGWVLVLPSRSGTHTSHRHPSVPAPPRQSPPPTGQPPAPHHAAAPGPHTGPATGPAQAPGRARAHHPAQPAAGHRGRREGPGGVHLPGGGLAGVTLAAAISAALVAWRLHRRRIAVPRWPLPGKRSEPPVPETIRALRRAHLRSLAADAAQARWEPRPGSEDPGQAAPAGADETAASEGLDEFGAPDSHGWEPATPLPGNSAQHSLAGTGAPAAAADGAADGPRPAPVTVPAAGWHAAGPPGQGSWPPPARALPAGTVVFGTREGTEIPLSEAARPGLALTGPGALPAARALMVGLLAAGPPGSGNRGPRVIVPADDARQLTEGQHPGAQVPGVTPGLPDGLAHTASLAAALDLIETQITRRMRLQDTTPPSTADTAPAPLALIATVDPPSAARVQAVLGAGAGITGILLGGQAPGPACHLGADGTVLAATDPALAGVQASHLTAADTAAMLSLLRGAQGHLVRDEPAPPQPPARRAPDHAAGTAPGRRAQPGTKRPGPAGTRGAAEAADPARPRPASQPDPPHPHQDRGPAQAVSPPAAPAAGPGRPVMVSVLGPVQITVGGREVSGGLRKARELVAYLAVHPQGVTGEQISADLWPESAPRYAASQRKLTLRKAREMLRAATGLPAPLFITRAGDRYRLDPALTGVDLWQFDAALARAQAAASEEDQLTALRQAAALYQGPLAEGGGYEWAEQHAEPARRRAVDALARIAAILRPGHPEEALAVLETALAHDPYNEALYQEIMGIQAQLGRPGDARRTLALLQTRLATLGLSPAPASRQAAGIPPAGPPAPSAPPAALLPRARRSAGATRPHRPGRKPAGP